MALTATVLRFQIELSDVDRGVYESLDLRVAQHPSETMRHVLTRVLAYALSFEPGIAFSKGGVSSTDEPPVAIRDPTGALVAWIDVGAPSADRLHRASKAAARVALFTSADLAPLRREAARSPIHRAADVEVWLVPPAFLEALEPHVERHTRLALTRSEGRVYVDAGEAHLEAEIRRVCLVEEDA